LRAITSRGVNFGLRVVPRSKGKGRAGAFSKERASVEETKWACVCQGDPADPTRSIRNRNIT
jgi:hypothetical protein